MTDIPSGYTPGPWKVYHAKLRPQFSTVIIEVQPRAGGQPIVAWPGFDNGHVTKKRHLANARLIALAPEMADEIVRLRALNAELLEGLNTIAAWHDGPKVSGHFDEPAAASVARALIAKAEGRT